MHTSHLTCAVRFSHYSISFVVNFLFSVVIKYRSSVIQHYQTYRNKTTELFSV
ncbi:unnamed protein product [Brugia timori]|uniref:Uncharacterized protein n=1 Tax=Brugia timori TaxID=42155 RepID=A0A3P7U0J6_9BILA|nr:unnamed protein product [Brugia timori]